MQSAVKGVHTIQVSHKNDPVVNSSFEIAGSEEMKIDGVSSLDYHSNVEKSGENPHNLSTFTDEVNATVPQSANNQ